MNPFVNYKKEGEFMDIKKEKSSIIVRSVEVNDGKETIVEEDLDNIRSETSLIAEKEIGDLFDLMFPEEEKE